MIWMISTYSVIYRVFMTSGEMIEIDNPLDLPTCYAN